MEEFLAGELDRRLKNGGKTFLNVPMREHTSFRIGGPAELLVTASDPQDIRTALAFAKENRLDVTVIGNGTNLLASDSGIPGMVLKIAGRPGIRLTGPEEIEAGAGALLSSVAFNVLSSRLKLTAADPAGIRRKMEELSATRREKQPLRQPSAGSVFKRPEGCFAGKLIEDCGLKGFSVGGARVSEKHAGFTSIPAAPPAGM